MRTRPKPWADREIAENLSIIQEPAEMKGRWAELFGNSNPIYLEIGCGKGGFIVKMAQKHPDINFIGLEKQTGVIVMGLRSAKELNYPQNLKFMRYEADFLNEVFEESELSRIYINFCDPWRTKAKWRKRRLTHRGFLDIYKSLIPNCEIFFKTDNHELFIFSLTEFEESGFALSNVSYDLKNDNYDDNIVTEYEQRFMDLGQPIYRTEARFTRP